MSNIGIVRKVTPYIANRKTSDGTTWWLFIAANNAAAKRKNNGMK